MSSNENVKLSRDATFCVMPWFELLFYCTYMYTYLLLGHIYLFYNFSYRYLCNHDDQYIKLVIDISMYLFICIIELAQAKRGLMV